MSQKPRPSSFFFYSTTRGGAPNMMVLDTFKEPISVSILFRSRNQEELSGTQAQVFCMGLITAWAEAQRLWRVPQHRMMLLVRDSHPCKSTLGNNCVGQRSSSGFFCTILWRNLNEFFGQPSRGLDILVRETETTPDLLAKLAGGLEDL